MDSTRGPQIWRDDRSNRRPAWGLTPHVSSLSLLVLVILGGACSVSAAPSTGRLSSAGHHPRLVSLKTRERVGDHDFRSRSDDESEYASNSTRVSELGGLFSDLNGYWWHGSRIAVGGALGARYEGVTKCIKRCDDMKHGCAGFVKEILSDHCTLVGRGYGLMQAAESDFYRKKALTNPAVWKTIEGMTARSPDIHAWRGVTASSRRELRAMCAADSQCQGFYTCSDFDAFNCTKILNEFHSEKNLTGVRPFHTNASAMLLSSVPDSVSRMSAYPSLVLDSRAIKTCDGNADGASCTFPFTTDYSAKHRQNNVEYFGPTLEGSSRPWCYTSKPGLWGYVDCHGQDPMGFKWEISEWGNCSRSCKRGMKTRTANCVNTTSGAVLPNQLCGVEPETSQECNTHSCDEKCAAIGVEDRKRCAPFVQDPRSRFMNVAVRAEVCHEYGCCFDYSETVLGTSECYVHKLESEASGCKKDWEWDAIASGTVRVPKPFTSNGGKPTKLFWNGWHEPGPLMDGQKVSTVTDDVTMCGRSCCRGDTELGPCAYDLGYSKPGAGQCSRFKSILAPDRYHTAFDAYFGEGDVGKGDLAADPPRMPPAVLQTIKMFTSKECREECDATEGCTAANFNKAESICELIKADAPSIAKFWDADMTKRYHILNSTSSLGASPGGNRIGWTAYTRHLGTRWVRGFTNFVTHVLADPPPQWGECRVVPKGQQLDPGCPWQQHKEIKGYVLPGDDIFRPDGYEVPWDKINSYHNGKPYMPLDDGDPDYPITYDHGMEIRKGPGPYNIHSIERPCYDVCNITKYCEDPLLSWYDSSSSNDETCSAPGNMATTRPGAIQHMTNLERRDTVGSCDGHGGPRKLETRVNLETYEQASARCERFGARLCEADEILRGAGLRGEGVSGKTTWEDANVFAPRDPWNYDPFKCTRDIRDDNAYWTSTPCGVGGGNATTGARLGSLDEVHEADLNGNNFRMACPKGGSFIPIGAKFFGPWGRLNVDVVSKVPDEDVPKEGDFKDEMYIASGKSDGNRCSMVQFRVRRIESPTGCAYEVKALNAKRGSRVHKSMDVYGRVGSYYCGDDVSKAGKDKGYDVWKRARENMKLTTFSGDQYPHSHFGIASVSYRTLEPKVYKSGRFVATRGGGLGKQCASTSEVHLFACCSDFKNAGFKSAIAAASRKRMNITLGDYHYCRNQQCKVYEGHCKSDGECEYGTQCARRVGAKYGFHDKANVCIPTYDAQQIRFGPRQVLRGSPTNFVFVESGVYTIPNTAKVKIIDGDKFGCMGAWDDTAVTLAETELKRRSEHVVRLPGQPVGEAFSGLKNHKATLYANNKVCDGELHPELPRATESTRPFMEWNNALVAEDKTQSNFDPTFETRKAHMCMCDNSTDCEAPQNWHDLGVVKLDVPHIYTFRGFKDNDMVTCGRDMKCPKRETRFDVYTYYTTAEEPDNIPKSDGYVAGFGGDLFEVYNVVDMTEYYPEMLMTRFTYSEQISLFKEFCAQRCNGNPLCVGFDLVPTGVDGSGIKELDDDDLIQRQCRMYRDGVMLHVIPSSGHQFYFSTKPKRETWSWFPVQRKPGREIEFTTPGGFSQVAPEGVVGLRAPKFKLRGTSIERLRNFFLSMNVFGNPPLPSKKLDSHRIHGLVYYENLYSPYLMPSLDYVTDKHFNVHSGNGRVFFPSLVEPKEIDDRMALTETYITARNRNRRGQKDFPRARIAYETNLAKKECEVSVAPPLDVVNQTTDGGLYWPSDVGTCGGNAHGAPCYKMFSPDPRDPDLIYFQCHVPDGETRSMCYTDKARTLWGYCDCPNSQWSRPFGRRNTMHNAEFRGGEVVMLTDDLHAPIDSIACENGIRGPSYDCKVHVNKSMCISSEVYGEFHPWKGFNSAMDASHSIANYNYGDTRTEYTNGYESMIEVTCPPGMVLTGIAAIKDKTSEGVMPRCGTPAGWTVGRVEESTIQSLDSYNFVTYLEDSCIVYNPSGGSTKSGRCTGVDWQPCPFVQDPDLKCRRRPRGVGIDADYVGCGPGEVAVGFFWSARSGTSKRLGSPDEHPSEIMPMCAPVTSTEPFAVTSGDFQRACTAQICSNLTNTIDTDDVAKCLKLCESESTCRASEFIEGNATSKMSGKCLLYAGTCTESTTPYGRILNQALPSPVTTTNAPVTYTPVEFEHPVTIKDLITFKVSSVKGSTFERLKFKRWVGTPFSSCSKPCGVGVMHRKISCVMIGSVVNVTIPDSECAHLPKPPEMEYCNKFHCELQCRQDTKRRSCAMYEADDRRRSSQFLIRQQTCEGFGCCFVPKPWISDFERAGPGESECYEAPRLEYPQWVPLSFGECSEDCQDPGSSALPYRERNLACANAIDGRRVPSDLCPAQKPMAIQQCNTKEPCVSSNCGLPEDVGSCGHGTCERSFSSDSPWKSSEKCTCFEGWMTGPSGACDLEIPACESNEWQLGEWGECVAGGLRSREVTCATDLMRASCKPTCDESTRPESTSACHVASSSSESFNSIPTNWTSGFWRENFDADKNHFVIMPHMEMKITGPIQRWWVDQDEKWTKIQAGFSALEAALGSSEDVRGNDSPSKRAAICASMCRATPTCPGFVFDYSKNMANACGFIHRRQFEVTTISRSESKHVFMRRGFITSFPQDELVRVVNSTNAWSSDLAAKVVDSNERLARRRSVIPSDDGIWDWINTAKTHGGVSLRKSLYSLAFPTHLNVLKHIRYLRNFLEPEFHGENLADVILAMAFKYRDYPSITNSTSTFVTHLRDAKLLDVCQISRETGAHDKAKMPLYRDPNPSPLGALHYLLKNNATASTMSSIWSFPWPILTMLGTAHVPKAECDYVRGRYSTSAEADRAFAVEEESTLATLDTKWYKEISRSTLERVETLCKTSNWHPNALPRAVQDGTTPARFPYVRWGHQACRGVPGVISTAGTLEFSMTEYGYVRAYSELWDTNLTFDRDMQSVLHTDDVPGIKKNRAVSVDHGRSTAIGINHGLDSNIDTRLAMLLFHNVYQEEGSHVIENVSRLLISALRNNPHNIEAWDLLISHITLGSLTNVGIIRDAYEVFRPVAKYYTRTFGALIEAMAMVFDCETDPTVHKYLMEEAIIVTRPQCDMKAREEIINGVNRNCKRHVFTIDDVKFIEEDFVRLAWGECEHRLVAEEDTVAPFYTESNRTRFDDIDEGTASKKDAFARLFKIHFHPLAVAQLKNPETAPGSVSFFLDIIKYITDTVWPQLPLGYLGHVGFVDGSSFPAITVDSWRVEHDEAKINAIGIRKKCSHESCEYIRELKKFRLHDTIAITSGLEMLETLHGWSMFAVNLTSTRLSPAVGGYPVVDDIVCETFLPEESCEKSQSPSTEHAYCRCSTFKTTSFKEFYAASAELTKVVNLSPIQKKLIAYVPAVKASIDNADLNLRSDEEDEGDISRLHTRKKIIYEKEEDYDALTRLLANVSSNLGETTASRQSSIILNARARSGRTRSRSLLGSSDTEPSSSDVSIMEHTTPNAEDFAMLDSRSTPFSVNNDTVFDTFSSAVEKHSGSPEDVSRTPVNVPVTEKVRVSEAPAPIAAVAPASALPVFSPLPTHSNDTKVITTYSIAVKKSRMDAQLKAIENVIKTRLHGGIKFHKLQVARSLRMVPTDGDGETATGEFSMQFTGFLGKHPKGVKRFSQVSAGPKTIAAMNGMLRRRGVAGASITANYMTDVEIHWSAKHEAFIRRTIGGLYRRAKNALAAGNRAGRNNFLRGAAFYKRLLNTAPRAIGGARRALLQSSTSSDAALGLPSHMTDLDNACVSVAFTKNVGDAEALQRAIYACGSPAASSPDEASKASFVPINNDDDFRNALKECTVLKSYCCPKCAKKPFWGSRWGSPGCCDDDRYADKKLHDCERKYGPISSWDTSKVTNMDHAFRSVTAKVGPHGYPSAPRIICVTQSINQSATGRFDDVANIDISNWDVSNVKSMNHMFHGFIGIYGDLSGWNVSQVTSMSHMFDDVRYLANTSTWDTSKVTDMSYMFKMHEGAPAYNRALLGNFIENFNVSAVTTMKRMFEHFGDGYHGERQRIPREFLWDNTPPMDLSRWELSSLTNMHSMFYRATTVSSFLHGAKDWDVRKVEDMSNMFQWSACGTLIDLSGWKTTSLRNMDNMFRDFPKWSGTCSANLSGWDLRSMTSLDGVFYNSKWTVLDLTGWNTSNIVSMAEMFKNAHIAPGSLETLNVHGVQNFEQMLCGTEWPSSNVDLTSWDVSRATNMKGMFRKANVKQIDVSTWDVRAVTSMANMFDSASNFNGDLSRWEPNKVTTMVEMFLGAVSFANDSPIRWRPTSLTTSVGMFNGAFKWLKFFARESEVTTVETSTDGPPFLWSVKSNVVTDENMRDMVERCLESNPVDGNCESLSIGIMSDWDVSRVTDMSELFLDAIRFNADISRWNVGAVTTMDRMFMGASAFNQDISAWKLTELVNSRGMFYEAKAFSQDITNWEIPNLSTSANMFGKATEILKHCKRDGQEKPITWSASGPPSKWKCDYPPKPPHAPSPPPNPSPPPIKDVIKEIHQGNFVHAITVCLSSNPIDGNCFESGYGAISDWDTSEVTDMSEAFANANEFNGDIERWDVSRVKKMFRMFYRAYNFNGNLTNWNVAEVTDMNQMFAKAYKFNGNIASWNVRSSPDMYLMFQDAKSFEANVTGWSDGSDTRGTFVGAIAWHKKYVLRACGNNIDSCGLNADSFGPASFRERIVLKYSALTDQTFRTAFKECLATNPLDGKCDLGYGWMSDWDTSAVTDMSKLFYRSGYGYRSQKFSVDISNWDTSNVTNMKQMFQYAKDWNGGEIGNWDVGAVTDMSEMFQYSDFNVDIGRWNVSAVTSFQDTFASSQFNKPIGDWPVRAASMRMMFASSEFNQDISRWDTSEVTDMSYMFRYNDNFDQDLSGWSVAKNPGRTMMFYSCSRFGGANYAPKSGYGCHQCFDNCCELHVYPPPQPAPPFPPPLAPGVVLVFEDKASLKEAVDDCLERDPVNGCAGMDTWDVSNVTNMESMFSGASSFNGDISGWDVSKVTNMERMFMETNSFNGDISGWDVSKVTNMERMFKDASSFNGDISGWDVSKVTNMESMFSGAPSFNGDISGWDVSGVTRMERMFSGASAFNGDISDWDVSKLIIMDWMFAYARAFNSDMSKWDVSKVRNMHGVFYGATSFDGDISGWDVSGVERMDAMFSGASAFNGDISDWDVSKVTRVDWMFAYARAFNSDISKWDVSKVTRVDYMFSGASAFNCDISKWDVSSIWNMEEMFKDATSFNIDISEWNVRAVSKMPRMFSGATSFDQDISKWQTCSMRSKWGMYNMFTNGNAITESFKPTMGRCEGVRVFKSNTAFKDEVKRCGKNMASMDSCTSSEIKWLNMSDWDVSKITDMRDTFRFLSNFNGDISRWDVSSVTNMNGMFSHASAFNGDISKWDVSSVTSMNGMFERAFAFNGDISGWDVSKVTNMGEMFKGAKAFNGDISKWDVSEVTNMNEMFSGASAFNSDISEWDVSKCTDARSLSSMFRYASSFDQNLSSWNVPCEPYPGYHLYRSFMGTKMTESMAPSVPCPTLTSASASGLGASSSAFPRVARASPVAVCAAAFIAAVAVVVATRAALRARRYPTPTGFPVHVGEETALLLPRRDRDAVTTAPMFWRGRV